MWWKLKNLTTVKPPFKMFYDGKPVSKITFHKKCAEALLLSLREIWDASGHDQKKIDEWGVSSFGGSFNYRLMRGSNHLSMHSYGIAIDLAPARFPMGQHTEKFNMEVIKAFTNQGAVNLDNDPMHFQFAKVG